LIGDQLVAEVVFQPLHGFVRMLGWHTFVSGYTQPRPRRQIHGASADHQNLSSRGATPLVVIGHWWRQRCFMA